MYTSLLSQKDNRVCLKYKSNSLLLLNLYLIKVVHRKGELCGRTRSVLHSRNKDDGQIMA